MKQVVQPLKLLLWLVKSGEAVNYSTAERIKHYQDLGYVLVTDGYPAGASFDLDSTVDQTWTVSFKRVALDFNPDNAHEPGTPIYPTNQTVQNGQLRMLTLKM